MIISQIKTEMLRRHGYYYCYRHATVMLVRHASPTRFLLGDVYRSTIFRSVFVMETISRESQRFDVVITT